MVVHNFRSGRNIHLNINNDNKFKHINDQYINEYDIVIKLIFVQLVFIYVNDKLKHVNDQYVNDKHEHIDNQHVNNEYEHKYDKFKYINYELK